MSVLGSDVNEIDYEQFCLLLNEKTNSMPTRFSSLFEKHQISGAIKFFDELSSGESDFIINFGDDEVPLKQEEIE